MATLDEPVTHRMVAHLDSMLERLRTGEPLQYVLGRWSFRQLDLAIDSRVLIPRPETELVAETAIALARAIGSPVTVADLGTGSGAIGLALADELPHSGTTVWITDVDADALDVARANLAGLGRAAVNVRVAQGSWFDALPGDPRFDLIVANPPYIADGSSLLDDSVREWEPHLALFGGFDGLDDIRHLVSGAPTHLVPRWMARARDRRRPRIGWCASCSTRPATPRSTSGVTSPATIGSPSVARLVSRPAVTTTRFGGGGGSGLGVAL